jgi:hypothetical protein
MSHVNDVRLNALLDGELPETEAAAILAHVGSGEACARRLEEAKRFLARGTNVLGDVAVPAAAGGSPAAAVPPAVAPAPGAPAFRPSKTAREIAVDLDGATQQSPAIRPNVDEAVPLFRSHPARTSFDPTSLAWAATIVLALGVGYLAAAVLHARAAMQTGTRVPAAAAPAPAAGDRSAPSPDTAFPAERPALPAPKTLNPRGSATVLGQKRLTGRPAVPSDAGRPAFRRATLLEAVNRLHGAIRLMDGMRSNGVWVGPGSLVASASRDHDVVRILYRSGGQKVTLDQQRLGGAASRPDTVFSTAPSGENSMRWEDAGGFWLSLAARLPPDSLQRLAAHLH